MSEIKSSVKKAKQTAINNGFIKMLTRIKLKNLSENYTMNY